MVKYIHYLNITPDTLQYNAYITLNVTPSTVQYNLATVFGIFY